MDKNKMKHLPHKTIERLSQYRRALLLCHSQGKTHIFSHEIATIQHITAVQVRRDIMLIGYTGTLRKGYNVEELVALIGEILDMDEGTKACVVGVGNLGRAFINYFDGKRTKLSIIAAFDINPDKIGTDYCSTETFHLDDLEKVIKEKKISIGIITVSAESAPEIADRLVKAGVKGILNYSPKPVNVPDNVHLEEYDMITSLEKVAFFVKTHTP
jgi:redox-sensing transcriptional repressor